MKVFFFIGSFVFSTQSVLNIETLTDLRQLGGLPTRLNQALPEKQNIYLYTAQ